MFDFLINAFALPEIINLLFVFLILFLLLLYVPILEWKFGQTLGKWLMQLRVLKENGTPLRWLDAFFRYYIRFVTALATFISVILILQRGQSITDMISNTKVVSQE